MSSKLTVGMMLYQEGQTLNKVLLSLRDVADSFILGVDKRSDDGTKEIAREWVYNYDDYFEFDWLDNFSMIRNEVLKRCKTRWFFQVDGHEFLTEQSIPFINELKAIDDIDLAHLGLTIWGNEEPIYLMMSPRIFRTDRDIIYERAIHNTLTCTGGLNDYCKLKNRDDPGIILDHKQPEKRAELRGKQRKKISFQGITKQAMERDDAYDWYNLGVLKTYSDDGKGAMEAFEKALIGCNRGDVAYQIKLFLAGLKKLKGDRKEARAILVSCGLDDPLRCEHIIELGALYEEDNELEKALVHYKMAVQFKIPASRMTVNLSYYSYFPYERLFKIYGKRGELINAIEVGEKLEQFTFFKHKEQLQSYLVNFRKKVEEADTRWEDITHSMMVSSGF